MPIPRSWSDVTEVPKPIADYQNIPVQCSPYVTDYIALMNRVDILIAPNTGSMHLAAALNTSVIGLFSGDHRSEHCGPFTLSGLSSILQAEDYYTGQTGLARINPQAVWEECQNLFR